MTPAGFQPTISAGERGQTHTLDRAATWTSLNCALEYVISTRHNTGIIFSGTCLLFALSKAVISGNVCETEIIFSENEWCERIRLKFMLSQHDEVSVYAINKRRSSLQPVRAACGKKLGLFLRFVRNWCSKNDRDLNVRRGGTNG
jgi:hypothetical protein